MTTGNPNLAILFSFQALSILQFRQLATRNNFFSVFVKKIVTVNQANVVAATLTYKKLTVASSTKIEHKRSDLWHYKYLSRVHLLRYLKRKSSGFLRKYATRSVGTLYSCIHLFPLRREPSIPSCHSPAGRYTGRHVKNHV